MIHGGKANENEHYCNMTPDNFNWDSFTHGIILDTTIEDVFFYISTSEGLGRWFIGNCIYTPEGGSPRPARQAAEKNDIYHWGWLRKELQLSGRVLDCDPAAYSFSCSFGPLFTVTIRLRREGERIRLTLRQDYIPGAEKDEFRFLNCCTCWVFFLTNLKSVIEYGCDLRETQIHDEMLINR